MLVKIRRKIRCGIGAEKGDLTVFSGMYYYEIHNERCSLQDMIYTKRRYQFYIGAIV